MDMRRRLLLLTVVAGGVMVAGAIAAVGLASRWSPWWYTSGPSACGAPAEYRIDGGPAQPFGGCAGVFSEPPASARVRVGQEIDVHMSEDASGHPGFPAPTSANADVLTRGSPQDGGATVSFRARSPGMALLATRALCQVLPPPAADELTTCAILAVTVIP